LAKIHNVELKTRLVLQQTLQLSLQHQFSMVRTGTKKSLLAITQLFRSCLLSTSVQTVPTARSTKQASQYA